MQHDVFANPAPRTRAAFPFVVVLQADTVDLGRRLIVAPLAPRSSVEGAPGRVAPVVAHSDQDYLLVLDHMTTVWRNLLRTPLGSIAAYQDDITRALDWLFTGV